MTPQSITLPRSLVEQAVDYIDNVPDDRMWGDYRDHNALFQVLRDALNQADAIDKSAERVHKSAESEHDATAKAIGAALACLKGLSGPNGAVSVWRLSGLHAVNEAIAQLEALGVR